MHRDSGPTCTAELENAHFPINVVFRFHRSKNGMGETKLEAACPQALCLPILNKHILVLTGQE